MRCFHYTIVLSQLTRVLLRTSLQFGLFDFAMQGRGLGTKSTSEFGNRELLNPTVYKMLKPEEYDTRSFKAKKVVKSGKVRAPFFLRRTLKHAKATHAAIYSLHSLLCRSTRRTRRLGRSSVCRCAAREHARGARTRFSAPAHLRDM